MTDITNIQNLTEAETVIMERARACRAPIDVVPNQVGQMRFIDTHSNQSISIGAARKILARYEIEGVSEHVYSYC